MITSLSNLHKVLATEYQKTNTSKTIEEVIDELFGSTYLKVEKDTVYLTSFLETNTTRITPENYELPLPLQPYIVCEKHKEGRWSIFGWDSYIDFIHQSIDVKEAVEDGRIETAIIVVEKGVLKGFEEYRKGLEGVIALIEL